MTTSFVLFFYFEISFQFQSVISFRTDCCEFIFSIQSVILNNLFSDLWWQKLCNNNINNNRIFEKIIFLR